jgi:hypothetical protein
MTKPSRFKVTLVAPLLAALAGCLSAADANPPDPADDLDVVGNTQAIVGGSLVTGAGEDQAWEGIVQLLTGSGRCTGTFISSSHILSSAHCFTGSGQWSISFRAPGLDWTPHLAYIDRTPCYEDDDLSCDLALVTLFEPEPWAAAGRVFQLYAGSTRVGTALHPYGYGPADYEGTLSNSNQLRGGAERAVVKIQSHTDGYFVGIAGDVRICKGDSGGPVMQESPGQRPVIWGVTSGGDESRRCSSKGAQMFFTKTTTSMQWIESVLGYPCSYDGDTATCW